MRIKVIKEVIRNVLRKHAGGNLHSEATVNLITDSIAKELIDNENITIYEISNRKELQKAILDLYLQ